MGTSIAMVDYGMGNLRSVHNALAVVDGVADLVSDPEQLRRYEKIILPGVGAFTEAISQLRQSGLAAALEERRKAGARILGICLGMQLMCATSAEDGQHQGLGWFDAKVLPFIGGPNSPVPHMGWNEVDFRRPNPLLAGLQSGTDAYFVHSYFVDCRDQGNVIATTPYDGREFASIICDGAVWGIQFHPEKSQHFGLELLRNFVSLPC